jgi:hypothetical protein
MKAARRKTPLKGASGGGVAGGCRSRNIFFALAVVLLLAWLSFLLRSRGDAQPFATTVPALRVAPVEGEPQRRIVHGVCSAVASRPSTSQRCVAGLGTARRLAVVGGCRAEDVAALGQRHPPVAACHRFALQSLLHYVHSLIP